MCEVCVCFDRERGIRWPTHASWSISPWEEPRARLQTLRSKPMRSCTTSSPSMAIWLSSQARAWSASHKTLVSLLPSLLAVVYVCHLLGWLLTCLPRLVDPKILAIVCIYDFIVWQLPVLCVYKLMGWLHGAPSPLGSMPCAAMPLQSYGQSLTAAAQHVGQYLVS